MKISTRIVTSLLMTGLLLSSCADQSNPVTGGMNKPDNNPSQGAGAVTAQSIGIAFNDLESNVTINSGDITWSFDHNCAMNYFTVVSSTKPSENNGVLNSWVSTNTANQCVFFNGGTLSGATITKGNPRNPDVFVIAPKNTATYPATVGAHQCWTSTLSGGTGSSEANLTVQADIAGESLVIRNTGNEFWEKKFSFSLTETDDDDVVGSRVNDVVYTLEKDVNGTWTTVETYNVGTIDPANIESGAWSHLYVANGGTFGNSTIWDQLVTGYTIGDILDDANGISGDNFEHNDSDWSGSDDNAMVAHGPSYTFTVTDDGTYRIRINATVKGNAGVATSNVTVTEVAGNVYGAPNCP